MTPLERARARTAAKERWRRIERAIQADEGRAHRARLVLYSIAAFLSFLAMYAFFS